MTSTVLRTAAVLLIVGSAVALFVSDESKVFASLLILGNLCSLGAHLIERRRRV
jgi:hypothetical protein